MFSSKALSLPSPFAADTRPLRHESEPVRPQPAGLCHFVLVQNGAKEQRCPCQNYQQNRNAPGNVCDCNHAACYHASSLPEDRLAIWDGMANGGGAISGVMDRIRRLEEAVQLEREIRVSVLARDRQSWEREVRILREALAPFYETEQEMQRKLRELEARLDANATEQSHLKDRMTGMDSVNTSLEDRLQNLPASAFLPGQRSALVTNGPHDTSGSYSGSEDQTSTPTEPSSPKQTNNVVVEPESPRSSGILNLVAFPRQPAPRFALPPRLSPPAELEEPRSSGFLGVDMSEIIQRRRLASRPLHAPPAYNSPQSSTSKSPPTVIGRASVSRSSSRLSPPQTYASSSASSADDRALKKRKHQAEIMALDVLADVSAASPVLS